MLLHEKNKSVQFFKDLTTRNGRTGFIKNLKYSFTENKFIKNMSLVGLGAAAVQAVTSLSLFGLLPIIQIIGQLVAGFAINNAVRGNVSIQSKSNSDVNVHLIKSIAILLIGLLATGLAGSLPLAVLFTYFTSPIITAGIIGIVESGIEKYRR